MEKKNLFVQIFEGSTPEMIDMMSDSSDSGLMTGRTFLELSAEHTNLVATTHQGFMDMRLAAFITKPKEITRESFITALECLPPMDWCRRGGSESFKMSEYYADNLSSIYVRIGSHYWTFRDVDSLSHLDILERVKLAGKNEHLAANS